MKLEQNHYKHEEEVKYDANCWNNSYKKHSFSCGKKLASFMKKKSLQEFIECSDLDKYGFSGY